MKGNENGITLTSLIIYITVMSVVIAAISTITTYTYKNMNNVEEEGQYAVELNKFDMYFLKDIKKAENISATTNVITLGYDDGESNVIVTYAKNDQYITRSDGNVTINICKNVTQCEFDFDGEKVNVKMVIDGKYKKNMNYIAENL